MKRIVYRSLVIFCIVFVLGQELSLAQEGGQAVKNPEWKQVRPGVQVATVWDTIGPKWPQSVLLQLQRDEYAVFLHAPERYINDLKVLGDSSTHKVELCHQAKVRKGAGKDIAYIVMFLHEPGTVVFAISYEIPPTPPK